MFWGISIQVIAGIINLFLTWYSVDLFLEKRRTKAAVVIGIAGIVGILFIGISAYHDWTSREDFRKQIETMGDVLLGHIQSIEKRAPEKQIVQIPNTGAGHGPRSKSQSESNPYSFNKVEQQRMASVESIRTKALELSVDTLAFVTERERGRPTTSLLPLKGETVEQLGRRFDQHIKAYSDFEAETSNQYRQYWWPKTLVVLQELLIQGFAVQSIWYQPSTTEQIKAFAMGLGVVAKGPP